jgi:hypothetical protein
MKLNIRLWYRSRSSNADTVDEWQKARIIYVSQSNCNCIERETAVRN